MSPGPGHHPRRSNPRKKNLPQSSRTNTNMSELLNSKDGGVLSSEPHGAQLHGQMPTSWGGPEIKVLPDTRIVRSSKTGKTQKVQFSPPPPQKEGINVCSAQLRLQPQVSEIEAGLLLAKFSCASIYCRKKEEGAGQSFCSAE